MFYYLDTTSVLLITSLSVANFNKYIPELNDDELMFIEYLASSLAASSNKTPINCPLIL